MCTDPKMWRRRWPCTATPAPLHAGQPAEIEAVHRDQLTAVGAGPAGGRVGSSQDPPERMVLLMLRAPPAPGVPGRGNAERAGRPSRQPATASASRSRPAGSLPRMTRTTSRDLGPSPVLAAGEPGRALPRGGVASGAEAARKPGSRREADDHEASPGTRAHPRGGATAHAAPWLLRSAEQAPRRCSDLDRT